MRLISNLLQYVNEITTYILCKESNFLLTHLKGFVNLKGGKGNALLYSVLPSASDIPSDVPFLLDESVVLDDDGVFEVHVSVGRCHVKLPGSATAVDWHIESGSSWVCG